jgi:hypothetical protein
MKDKYVVLRRVIHSSMPSGQHSIKWSVSWWFLIARTPKDLPDFLFVRLSLQKLRPAAIGNIANGDTVINQIQEWISYTCTAFFKGAFQLEKN